MSVENSVVCRTLSGDLYLFALSDAFQRIHDIRMSLSTTLQVPFSRLCLFVTDEPSEDWRVCQDEDLLQTNATYEIFVRPVSVLSWIPIQKLDLYGLAQNLHPEAVHIVENFIRREPNCVIESIWRALSGNPQAVSLMIQEYPQYICWKDWCTIETIEAIEYTLRFPEHIVWSAFSANSHPLAVCHMKSNSEKIDWDALSKNVCPDVVPIMEDHLQHVQFRRLGLNQCPEVVRFLLTQLDHVDKLWRLDTFSLNATNEMVTYLIHHPDEINWVNFCRNPNPLALDFLFENYSHKIAWKMLALNTNPTAMNIVKQNLQRLIVPSIWEILLHNPSGNWVPYVIQHIDEFRQFGFSRTFNLSTMWSNPKMMPIFEYFKDDVCRNINWCDWYLFSKNPSIFES